MNIKIISFLILALSYLHIPTLLSTNVQAISPSSDTKQETTAEYIEDSFEGRVEKILGERRVVNPNNNIEEVYQQLEILITKGAQKDKTIKIESGNAYQSSNYLYKVGDRIILTYSQDLSSGEETYLISDYIRRTPLLILFIIFIAITIVISKWKGLSSILGMGVSFFVIIKFILPSIYSGNDPVMVAILGSIIIIPVTFFLSHGINKKTLIAVIGTLLSLVVTGILAVIFVEATKLTGFASEEAGFLNVFKEGSINIKGLLLAGIIIGVLGVLDDITISQSAIVQELIKANPKYSRQEIFQKAMSVGKDHIASMVNTLILVYAGASLPLLLLFVDNPRPFAELINYEIVADEIVRTLVGSIGLVLAVPITTFLSSYTIKNIND